MKHFFSEIKNRNKLLYFFGWYNFLMGIICMSLIPFDDMQVLGISRWIKPMKFFFSVGLMSWTMAWLMHYLASRRGVRIVSWLIVISMFIENFIIMMQSVRGTTSHFNVRSDFDGILFGIMGLFILVFTGAVIYAAWLFFKQKEFSIPATYVWGIRLGILLFIIFSIQGGFMLSNSGHTVGAADGGAGLPLVNWSKEYGDLRVAHFFGMHALQIIPLVSYYFTTNKKQVFLFSALYFIMVMVFLAQALYSIPFM